MFTGIIEELGEVRAVEPRADVTALDIAAQQVVLDASIGDSIAVNGVCLTAVDVDASGFRVEVIPESLDRSSLGTLQAGSKVNLERPMKMGGRLDGHIVQGHVDAVARIVAVGRGSDGGFLVEIELSPDLAPYVVEKGSITVDGVSLTVAGLTEASFSVALIPHTLEVTTLGERKAGDPVNLEVDVIAKYVARKIGAYTATPAGEMA